MALPSDDTTIPDPTSTQPQVEDQLELGNWKATAEGASPVPIQRGEPWPSREGVLVFERHTVTVPPEWPLDRVRLQLDMGGSGHAWIHSKLGKSAHEVVQGSAGLPVPALAFGLRVEVEAPASDDPDAPIPVLGLTRLALIP